MGILGVYLLLPLFREDAIFPLGLALNAGKSWNYYLIPVAAIVILLVLPNIRRWGREGMELGPLPSKEEARLSPLESLPEQAAPPQAGAPARSE